MPAGSPCGLLLTVGQPQGQAVSAQLKVTLASGSVYLRSKQLQACGLLAKAERLGVGQGTPNLGEDPGMGITCVITEQEQGLLVPWSPGP